MAERNFGPVDVLVLNASSWIADTFLSDERDPFDRALTGVSAGTYGYQFSVDTRANALLIAEFARRHLARHATWGRIIVLTSDGPSGFLGEVSYGAAKAALGNYVKSAGRELGRHGVTANMVYPPVTDTGWITLEVERA